MDDFQWFDSTRFSDRLCLYLLKRESDVRKTINEKKRKKLNHLVEQSRKKNPLFHTEPSLTPPPVLVSANHPS